MTDNHRENLSAGMDGELSSEAIRFLLRRLEHDDSLRQAWSSYGLIGDGMRGNLPPLASADFADRVMQAIERDGTSRKNVSSPWLRWSVGGLIAASVAVVALTVNRPAGNGADQARGQVAVAVKATSPAQKPLTGFTGGVPARVPSWLSSNNDISLLSEQAAATRFLPFDGKVASPAPSPYPLVGASHQAATSAEGSYLLLDSRHVAPAAAARTKNQ